MRLEPARVKPLSGAEFRIGSLLANVRLTSKGFLRANTLAYIASIRDKVKSLKTITLFGNVFKHFSSSLTTVLDLPQKPSQRRTL